MKGMIFNIQRFCVHDGPGIRTTVFFKGCPLSCAWCHNPESQRTQAEIFFSPEKCIDCGACVKACPKHLHAFNNSEHGYDRAACDACGACAGVCPAGALEMCGREADAGEILEQVLRDADFYRSSGGGITLSGGEPMAQGAFALELAQGAMAAGLHVCIETCGVCARAELERILPYADLFLYDYKLADGEMHRRYTGADNALILENLAFIGRAGTKIVLRCPVIPEVNFTDEHFDAIARTVRENPGILQIDLEPYHPLGIDKARRLGRTAAYDKQDPPDPDRLQRYVKRLEAETGIPVSL
jgi:glycyl-radical enzyme activating protein family